MKKIAAIIATAVAIMIGGSAMAIETAEYTADSINNMGGHSKTSLRASDGKIFVELYDVFLTPIGVNTNGKDLKRTDALLLYSGIVDAGGDKRPCDIGKVKDGRVAFKGFPNSGLIKKVPIVEHLWTRSPDGKMAGTLDPLDPWVIGDGQEGTQHYLDTLVIGIVMCSDGSIIPLKSLGLGKLKQGPHPELINSIRQ